MLQRMLPVTEEPRPPLRRLRILIEDPLLNADRPVVQDPATPFEVAVCSGPASDREICPLVVHGTCPLGPCDVVVTALEGAWSASVHAAWRQEGVPVVDARDVATSPASDRLTHYIGAAVAAVLLSGPPAGAG